MQIKFSLSGGEWMTGDRVDNLYARVVEFEFPASLITSMWCDRDMLGSIDISLSKISCRFSIVDAPRDDFIAIMQVFTTNDYPNDNLTRLIYNEMLALKKIYNEETENENKKDENQGILF